MAIQAAPNIPASRRANKAEAAEFFGVSLPTINAWISKGAPVLQKGSRGIPWVLDLLALAEWRFTGGAGAADPDAIDPDRLPPNERLAWYRAEKERRAILKEDRVTLDSLEVTEVVATAYAAHSQEMRAVPDRLERRLGIAGEVAEAVGREIDAALDATADKLQSIMLGGVDGALDD